MHLLPLSLHKYTKYQEYYFVLHDHQQFILECISLNLQRVLSLFRYCIQHDKVLEGGEGMKEGRRL